MRQLMQPAKTVIKFIVNDMLTFNWMHSHIRSGCVHLSQFQWFTSSWRKSCHLILFQKAIATLLLFQQFAVAEFSHHHTYCISVYACSILIFGIRTTWNHSVFDLNFSMLVCIYICIQMTIELNQQLNNEIIVFSQLILLREKKLNSCFLSNSMRETWRVVF